jgi:hypothetical protein
METIQFPGINYHSVIEINVQLISSVHDDLHCTAERCKEKCERITICDNDV